MLFRFPLSYAGSEGVILSKVSQFKYISLPELISSVFYNFSHLMFSHFGIMGKILVYTNM